jgi:RNA polymerase sigma-70 factor (ECF subfamily)
MPPEPANHPSAEYASDEALIEAFADPARARAAFNQLVRKYQQPLYRIIRRIVIDHDETDDLLQEAFVKIWRHLGSFRQDAKLSTWLYRIATNEALSHLRKKRQRYFLPIGDVEGELSQKLDASLAPDADEIQRRLQQAIIRLPERQRVVFQLRYFDEMKYEDMAEVLGVTVGALKASYHHATQKLEKYLLADLNQ